MRRLDAWFILLLGVSFVAAARWFEHALAEGIREASDPPDRTSAWARWNTFVA